MAEQTEQTADTKVEPQKGRSAILEAYKAQYPDNTEEPDDETLHDFSNSRYSDLEGKHNEMAGANEKLADLVSKDPKLSAVLSMLVGEKPKSLPYAVSSVYGKGAFDLEGDALNDYEAGHQDYLKEEARKKSENERADDNFKKSTIRLNKYYKDNGLDEEQSKKLYSGIMDLAENFLTGNIPDTVFDLVHKGLSYDKDVQDAADTGFVEGKNDVVEAKMKTKKGEGVIPDLNNSTGAGKIKKLPPVNSKKSFYDAFKDENV